MTLRKLVLYCAVAGIVLAGGFAVAQNITKALQVSQDPTGLIGYDTNNNTYFPNHINSTQRGGKAPVLSGCGTAPSFTGSDNAMVLTTGSAATTCTVTFGTAFVVAPACAITAAGGAIQPTYTTSATAITITVDIASTVYHVVCMGAG